MGKYDNVKGMVEAPPRSTISSCCSNSGAVRIGSYSEIAKCNHNTGNLKFGEGVVIDTIAHNAANIIVGDNSFISQIKYNVGNVILGNNCLVYKVKNNAGLIRAGPGSSIPPGQNNAFTGRIIVASPEETSIPSPLPVGNSVSSFLPKPVVVSGAESAAGIMAGNSSMETSVITSPGSSVSAAKKKRKAPEPPTRKSNSSEDREDKDFCSICMENLKDTAFSCGHVCCFNCSESMTDCHMCRKKIEQRIKLFL